MCWRLTPSECGPPQTWLITLGICFLGLVILVPDLHVFFFPEDAAANVQAAEAHHGRRLHEGAAAGAELHHGIGMEAGKQTHKVGVRALHTHPPLHTLSTSGPHSASVTATPQASSCPARHTGGRGAARLRRPVGLLPLSSALRDAAHPAAPLRRRRHRSLLPRVRPRRLHTCSAHATD